MFFFESDMYAYHPSLRSKDGPPTRIEDVFTLPSPRKNHDLGAAGLRRPSHRPMGEGVSTYVVHVVHEARREGNQERHRAKAALAAQYADQQRRLAEGETLGEDEKKIDGKRLRTKRWLVPQEMPRLNFPKLTEGLLSSKRGLFKQSAIPSVSKASLPTVVAIDPFGDTATSGQQADSTSR